jgi:tape measure domain-containing protein
MAQGKITRADIIDDGVKEAIKELGQAIKGIADDFDEIIKKSGQLRQVLANDIKVKSFSELVTITEQLEKNIKDLIASQTNLNAALNQSGKTGKQQYDLLAGALNTLTKAIKDQSEQQERLRKAQEAARESAKKKREEEKKNTDQLRETIRLEKERQAQLEKEAKYQQELAKRKITAQAYDPTSIQGLTAQNRILELQMKRLNPLIESERLQFQKLTNEYVRNKEEIARLNAEKRKLEQQGKGLGGLFGTLGKSVMGVAAAYFSLNQAVGLVQKIFRDTKELDKIKLIFNSFIKDTQELATTFEFLGDIAARYGLDLLNLSERYAKFRAATLASKLSLEETRGIFETFAKASSILGLRTDEVRGVFLALEQMMSKGKVTTEELRRQLGERLPGAVNILALSMKKSTRELDSMLKKGQVISEEVLPEFARTLERVYGIESIRMIDTLAAAQGRMNKAWLDFVDALNATPTFKESFNFLTRFLADLKLSIDSSETAYYKWARSFSMENARVFDELDKLNLDQIKKDKERYAERLTTQKGASKAAIEEYIKSREAQDEMERKSESKRAMYSNMDSEMLDNRVRQMGNVLNVLGKQIESLNSQRILNENMSQQDKDRLDSMIERQKYLIGEYDIASKIQQSRKQDLSFFQEQLKNAKEIFEVTSKLTTTRKKYKEEEGSISFGKDEQGKNQEIDIFEGGIESYEMFLRRMIEMHKDNYDKRRILEEALYDEINKGSKKPDEEKFTPLEKAKKNLEIDLNRMETAINDYQAEMIASQEMTDNQIKSMEQDKNRQLLEFELDRTMQMIELTKEGTEERTKVEEKITDIMLKQSELRKDIAEDEFNFEQQLQQERIREQEADAKARLKFAETNSDILLAQTILNLQKEATEKIQISKNNAKAVAQIESDAAMAILNAIYQSHIDKEELYKDDAQAYAEWQLEKLRLQQDIEKATQDNIVKTSKLTTEQLQKQLQFLGESVNTAFDVMKQFRQDYLGDAEAAYNRDMLMAGTSVRKKMAAEEKLYNAKKLAARKAARMEKAQALFNIGLSTAQAIIGIWAQVPKFDLGVSAGVLTAIVAALGAAQMAAVLAQPVPAYEKGGITEGGVAMVGEKGKELMIMPTGEKYLSPDAPSLLNLPKGTEIIPHDDTQKILANAAKNNFIKETIDLSLTNNYLREIRDRETVNIVGNYKYVNKNGIKARYAIGV